MVRCVNRLRGCLGRVETRGKDYKYEFNEIINDLGRNNMKKRKRRNVANSNISGMVWL